MLSASEAIRSGPPLTDHLQTAQKLKTAADITGGVAHAFNNLLTSVMGYVLLAQERALDNGDMSVVAQLDQATDSCRRARDLVQRLLTYTHGRQTRANRPVRMGPGFLAVKTNLDS